MHINSTWSQHQEDLQLVRHFFCDICEASRTYVEIGALDGVRFSNTMLLEHQFNFGGLLIEGHPFSAQVAPCGQTTSENRWSMMRSHSCFSRPPQCLVAARGRSGRNLVINEAVCDPPGSVTFVGAPIAMAGDRATMASGFHDKYMTPRGIVLSQSPCTLLSPLSHSHHIAILAAPHPGHSPPLTCGRILHTSLTPAYRWKHLARLDDLNFSVPCRPIGAMLRLAGLETVHFFSLDVEGAELRVLQA
jgi:hypothetical protein